jgi:hypothetical protein
VAATPDSELSLAELAAEVGNLAAQVLAGADRRERMQHLRERKEQIDSLRERTVRLVATRERLSGTGVEIRPAKRSIRPRLTSLGKLETKVTANVNAVLEATALNQDSLDEGLAEAESAMLNDWRVAVAPPDSTAAIAEGALEVSELADTARRLRQCRDQLVAAAARLPQTRDDARKTMGVRREHDSLAEKLASAGLKPEILEFLQRARSESGMSLAEVLSTDTVMIWLKGKNRAAAFRVKTTAGSLRFSK